MSDVRREVAASQNFAGGQPSSTSGPRAEIGAGSAVSPAIDRDEGEPPPLAEMSDSESEDEGELRQPMARRKPTGASAVPAAAQKRVALGSAVSPATDRDEGEPPPLADMSDSESEDEGELRQPMAKRKPTGASAVLAAAQKRVTHSSGVPPATERVTGAAEVPVVGTRKVRWQTDSFVAMFSTAIKPSADNYALFREDHEHIVKYGTSLHGECFCDGVRIPRHDGAPHVAPLPDGTIPRHTGGMSGESRRWTLRDAAPGEFRPTFPELQVHLVITDGCGCQVKLYRDSPNPSLLRSSPPSSSSPRHAHDRK